MELRLNSTKSLVLSALLVALGVILPTLCHVTGTTIPGRLLVPMFFPVMLGALILPLRFVLLTAVLVPVMNHLLKGMPPVPLLWFITAELFIYAAAAYILRSRAPQRICIILAFLAGRASYLAMLLAAVKLMGVNLPDAQYYFLLTAVPMSVPGIILQTAAIPLIYNKIVMVINSGN